MKFNTVVIVLVGFFMTNLVSANDGSNSDVKIPNEVLEITSGNLPINQKIPQLNILGFVATSLPVQMRTAYALGDLQGCETVISLTNLANKRHIIEVEFFTGFNFIERGFAKLELQPGETGEVATTANVSPFVINSVRDSSVPFEGYALISSKTDKVGAHAHMVCGVKGNKSYQDINIFKYEKGVAVQLGD
jgi:hypothetical protein